MGSPKNFALQNFSDSNFRNGWEGNNSEEFLSLKNPQNLVCSNKSGGRSKIALLDNHSVIDSISAKSLCRPKDFLFIINSVFPIK